MIEIKEALKKLPEPLRELISAASAAARQEPVNLYLVGGFVRDMLLGVENFDVDLMVEKDGIKFAQSLCRKLKAHILVHPRFGTATVSLPGTAIKVDVCTARKETYPAPASLPVVSPGTVRDDLLRRDFTINAMAVGLTGRHASFLVDFYGGSADLEKGVIRVLHAKSFSDDPTRMLRAARFQERFGFRLDPATRSCLREAAKGRMIEMVQPHRLRDELVLILKEKNPVRPLHRLGADTGLEFVSPGLSFGSEQAGLARRFRKEFEWHQMSCPRRRKVEEWLLYLMALLDPLPAAKVSEVCRRFAFLRNDQVRLVSYAGAGKAAMRELAAGKASASQAYGILKPFSVEVLLALKAKFCGSAAVRYVDEFLRVTSCARLEVTGAHLSSFGLTPGPHYQKILDTVLAARIDGTVNTREEEFALARLLAKKHRGV